MMILETGDDVIGLLKEPRNQNCWSESRAHQERKEGKILESCVLIDPRIRKERKSRWFAPINWMSWGGAEYLP